MVVNYIDPEDGQGIQMFFDQAEVSLGTHKNTFSRSAGDGRIVVGKYYTELDQDYASVMIDELIFFNKTLTNYEIEALYNNVG